MKTMPVLELKNITKTFGSVIANKEVSLTLNKGEILSILGENGSGKTTLMNAVAGIYYPDSGEIFVNGEKVDIRNPLDAYKYKIGMIHQHFKLVETFTGIDNILLGSKQPFFLKKNRGQKIEATAFKYGFEVDFQKFVSDMSVSEKQTVEIVKALYKGADILILDEPTAVLTPQETRTLFKVLKNMKEDGKSIIIITHKLNEVLEVSDKIAVLRKGENVGTLETKNANEKILTELMVGKKIELNINRSEPTNSVERLFVSNLNYKNPDGKEVLKDVSFTVNSGEILGIAGISGSGQKELLECIAGLLKFETGDIIFRNPKKNLPASFFHKDINDIKELAENGAFHDKSGKSLSFSGLTNKEIRDMVNNKEVIFNEDEVLSLKGRPPLEIRQLGIHLSFVPEDRLGMGLVGDMNITDNMMLRSYRKHKGNLLDRKTPEKLAKKLVEELEIVTPSVDTNVSKLSGGNIQKVLVGREIAYAPKVFMAAYPVRGLDINSSYLIYNLLEEQKRKGVCVIYVGEDLDVLLALCDRIAVLANGKITANLDARKTTKEEVGKFMLGGQ